MSIHNENFQSMEIVEKGVCIYVSVSVTIDT